MVKLHPVYSYSTPWFRFSDTWAKGYAYTDNGVLLQGEALAEFFSSVENEENLIEIAANLNGLFCAMGYTSFGGFAVVDRVRSIPVFYINDNGYFNVSDSPYTIAQHVKINPQAYSEFLSSGYCLKNRTLIDKLYQVEASSVVLFSNESVKQIDYFSYATKKISRVAFVEAKKELKRILDQSMRRFVNSIDGKHIAIPLSGGYDSRFILAWLVSNGIKNVSAFTYGRERSSEIALAKKVAEKLKVEWHPIVYNSDMMVGITQDRFFADYIPFASLACSMPFFQDYPAMRYIKTHKIIPVDSVIVPGHSGDFLAGSHLFQEHQNSSNLSIEKCIQNRHHRLLNTSNQAREEIRNEIGSFINFNAECLPYSILEWWDFRERQAKFIVNSTRTYQYFGYTLRLPLFDTELIDFFKLLPFEHKLAKKLYIETLEDYFFNPLNIVFRNELQPTVTDIYVQQVKDRLKQQFPFLLKFKKKPIDNNCYGEISARLYAETGMKQSISTNIRQTNAPIVEWYLKYFDIKIGDWILRKTK